jgi:hypothetical protein
MNKHEVEILVALSLQYELRFYVLPEMHMESTNSNNKNTMLPSWDFQYKDNIESYNSFQ